MSGTTILTLLVLLFFGAITGYGLGLVAPWLMRLTLVITMATLWVLTTD